MKTVTFIGLDVHKRTIDVVIAEEERDSEVRHYGKIPSTKKSIDKMIRYLISNSVEPRFVYEAGPCGYTLYRYLTDMGYDCEVIAPSLIPKKSGDRIKTDRRDAKTLARLHRAGELTPIVVPIPEDEAMRDLIRAREDAKITQKRAKQQLNGFLLRNGYVFTGKKNWSQAHYLWISDIKMAIPTQQITLQEYVNAVNEGLDRVERLEESIRELLPQWRWAPLVKAIQSLRGVALIVAVTTIAELGDLSRFATPDKLMAFLGLVPSELLISIQS